MSFPPSQTAQPYLLLWPRVGLAAIAQPGPTVLIHKALSVLQPSHSECLLPHSALAVHMKYIPLSSHLSHNHLSSVQASSGSSRAYRARYSATHRGRLLAPAFGHLKITHFVYHCHLAMITGERAVTP